MYFHSDIWSRYTYDKKGLSGKWFIFGAKIECGDRDKICQIKEKLIKEGYSIENHDDDAKILKILPCQKLFDLANQLGLKTVSVISRDKVSLNFLISNCPSYFCKTFSQNIGEVVESLQDEMKKGKLEGIIFSLKDKGGDKICKWKGPQEYQPSIHKRFLDANDTIIQPSNSVDEKVKSIFKIIADVILDISQNKAMSKKGLGNGDKKVKQGQNVLTNEDKVTWIYIFYCPFHVYCTYSVLYSRLLLNFSMR